MDWQWFRTQLLTWYGEYGRDLPWRPTADPYAVLVSEFMLQQTQVMTVIPYYQRWLKQLPTLADCAQAQRQDIFKLWEGLGYYRRAEYLHQTCQMIMYNYGGNIPQELAILITLPGIGRTTAGGILSHAFNLPLPILDGNVQRVLSRLFALTTPPNRNQKQLWHYSQALLDPDQPGRFNQALMDVGAGVCLPKVPHCGRCPWQNGCMGEQTQQQHTLPVREPAKEIPHRTIGVGVIWNAQGQVLIDQRPSTGLLANLWEFPGGKVEPGESVPDCIRREIQEELALDIRVGAHLITVNHRYTHLRVTLVVHHGFYQSGIPELRGCQAYAWVELRDLSEYPFPQANHKIIQALATSPSPPWPLEMAEGRVQSE
ncbi:A/G-specific adenine glycosylase [Gloeomargarita lithophora Alchichica-D10]|uniref:Adenine DNA glycosylase n=1 Tax=Gloeomargarita lithophora Alchichica-D10 TaxID=1188229 RepID=A0A1J0AC51_9CYAN|nr:A/G-specific adenine glycosylase [Gloeomargarita lithophora]APB33481.1 A/G-specific adenine glycosylase [Gloeomargarita lithophora Alchichica-D10]